MMDKKHSEVSSAPIPPVTLAWGWAGVIPFVCLAGAISIFEDDIQRLAWPILVPYGAIILTFMGGVHWGIAMCNTNDSTAPLYTMGIMPSLIAVLAIVLPSVAGIAILGAGFALLLLYDIWLVKRRLLPEWYGRLRLRLTFAVIVCLAVAGISFQLR